MEWTLLVLDLKHEGKREATVWRMLLTYRKV